MKWISVSTAALQNGHKRSASHIFLTKRSLCDFHCETPRHILIKEFLAFACLRLCKIGDMDKIDLNVLYKVYCAFTQKLSGHSCLYSVIVLSRQKLPFVAYPLIYPVIAKTILTQYLVYRSSPIFLCFFLEYEYHHFPYASLFL